jgi:hypothetical protein
MRKIAVLFACLTGCTPATLPLTEKWEATLIDQDGQPVAAWQVQSRDSLLATKLETGVTIVAADGRVVLSAPNLSAYRIRFLGPATSDEALIGLTIDVPLQSISNWSDPERTPPCPFFESEDTDVRQSICHQPSDSTRPTE